MVRFFTSLILSAAPLLVPLRGADAQRVTDTTGMPYRALDAKENGSPHLRVTVRTPTGVPIRDALVRLDELPSYSRTDSSGRAYLGPVMTGKYHLRVLAIGHRMYRDTIAVTSGRLLHIVLPVSVFDLSEICSGSCARVSPRLAFPPIRAIRDSLMLPPSAGTRRQPRPNERLQLSGRMRGGSRAVSSN
jgi:hypothetical protein